jgi:hypothetical protein
MNDAEKHTVTKFHLRLMDWVQTANKDRVVQMIDLEFLALETAERR